MSSDAEELISRFEKLGFTQYEAKVYMALLDDHPASAYSISQKSGVPHSRVYDITRRLIKAGFVMLAGVNPDKYTPLAPQDFIQKLTRDHVSMISELESKLKTITFTSDFDPVWNIFNSEKALLRAQEIINEAQSKIYIGVWDNELKVLIPKLENAHKRGVKITFLIYGQETIPFGKYFYHDVENLSNILSQTRSIDIIADSSVCISGSIKPDNNTCEIVWTKNKGLVKSIEEYIIHDFYIAEIMEKFNDQISEVFGNNLSKLRALYS